MTDDELLIALRDTVRTEESALRSERWDLPPTDATFLDRMTDVALRELTAKPSNSEPLARIPRLAKPRGSLQKAIWALPLVAAAAALFVLLTSEPAAPIAQYRVEIVQGAERATRDADGGEQSLALRPGLAFELTLRPATQTPGPLAASVYLGQTGRLLAVPVEVEVTALGVVHVRGALPDGLDVSAKDSYLVVSVARPEALPTPALLQSGDTARGSGGFQSFRIEIRARRP